MVFLAFMIRTIAASILRWRKETRHYSRNVHVLSVFINLVLSLADFTLTLRLGYGQHFDTDQVALEFIVEAVSIRVRPFLHSRLLIQDSSLVDDQRPQTAREVGG